MVLEPDMTIRYDNGSETMTVMTATIIGRDDDGTDDYEEKG